jgi:CHAD domain-containing protein
MGELVPHRIRGKEDIGTALLRLVSEDIGAARSLVIGSGPAETRIHRARQKLKRARSALRVLRPALGDKAVAAAAQIRDAARLLARARDADAAAASARSLKAVADNHSIGEDVGLERVVATLDYEARSTHSRAMPVTKVVGLLKLAERQISAAPDDLDGMELFERAIDRGYRRGRAAMRSAMLSLSTPDLHRWRKTVKDLWHLTRLARKRLPARSAALAKRLDDLSELLGLDHDHAMLAERLALSPTGDPALMQQLSLIAKRRRALEAEAFTLGNRLYRKPPKEFRKRMRLA